MSGKSYTTKKFIEKARNKHPLEEGKINYCYCLTNYKRNDKPIKIICSLHGVYTTIPKNHLKGYSCPKCGDNVVSNTEEFIEKAKKVHGENTYDYSKVEYVNRQTKVIITCQKHDKFLQTPGSHLHGRGCPACGIEKRSDKLALTRTEFLSKAKKIHGNKYDYSLINLNFKGRNPLEKFICTSCNHTFYQTTEHHLKGHGCPYCKFKNESYIRQIFEELFKKEFPSAYPNCLKTKKYNRFQLDGYNEELRLAFEYQGEQHFVEGILYNRSKGLKVQQERDKIKKELCKNNNIFLVDISYVEIKNNLEDLVKLIKQKIIDSGFSGSISDLPLNFEFKVNDIILKVIKSFNKNNLEILGKPFIYRGKKYKYKVKCTICNSEFILSYEDITLNKKCSICKTQINKVMNRNENKIE